MSLDLKDLRAKIHVETWCALEAECRARGMDQSELVREIMHVWASQRLSAASILQRLLRAEGISGSDK